MNCAAAVDGRWLAEHVVEADSRESVEVDVAGRVDRLDGISRLCLRG